MGILRPSIECTKDAFFLFTWKGREGAERDFADGRRALVNNGYLTSAVYKWEDDPKSLSSGC